jgi:hypothetical protein
MYAGEPRTGQGVAPQQQQPHGQQQQQQGGMEMPKVEREISGYLREGTGQSPAGRDSRSSRATSTQEQPASLSLAVLLSSPFPFAELIPTCLTVVVAALLCFVAVFVQVSLTRRMPVRPW